MNKPISPVSLVHIAPVALLFLFMVGMWVLKTQAFIADDSYFYLVISRNLALEGHQTFSGIMSTNGAHPLWLYLLTAYSWVVSQLFGHETLNSPEFALPLSIALLAGGCIVWWRIGRILRIHQPTLVFVPMAFITFFGVLYSEIHLLFFTLSLLILSVIRRDAGTRMGYIQIGVLSALVVLSRLDTIFLIGALGVLLFISDRDIRGPAIMSLTFAAIALPYVVSNYLIFGHPVPISGYIKSTFPEVIVRGFETQGGGLSLSFEGYSIFFGILPIAFAVALWPTYRDRRTRLVIAAILGGAILQFLQIALFTRSHTGWYWYYLLPVIAGALATANLLSLTNRRFSRLTPLLRILVLNIVLLSIAATITIVTVNIRWNSQPQPPKYMKALEFVTKRDIQETAFLVSDGPGYFAYSRPSNGVIAADMLTGNVSVITEMKISGNAMRYLFDTASDIDKPIRYVIFMGGSWLIPSTNLQCVIYNDPLRLPSTRNIIGQVHLGYPIETDLDNRFIVWDASNPRFDVSADDPLCQVETEA